MPTVSKSGSDEIPFVSLPALYNAFQLASRYLSYLLHASNGRGHGIHSPFVFDFVTKVLNDRRVPEAFRRIESYRQALHQSRDTVTVEDFGAGSAFGSARERAVAQIARRAAKPARYGRLLYRIAEHYRCRHILELGTSLGVSTAYLASAPGVSRVVTMEGARAIAARAREGFASLGLDNIRLVEGNFDDTLEGALGLLPQADLVFVDGNHREEPTLRYFRQCLQKSGSESIFIFDDIHWSPEMESAWAQIKAHPDVRCTIDLFFVGIVLFRDAFREKQHFVIRY
jgi:predicted O-methyltransferase YrrM